MDRPSYVCMHAYSELRCECVPFYAYLRYLTSIHDLKANVKGIFGVLCKVGQAGRKRVNVSMHGRMD